VLLPGSGSNLDQASSLTPLLSGSTAATDQSSSASDPDQIASREVSPPRPLSSVAAKSSQMNVLLSHVLLLAVFFGARDFQSDLAVSSLCLTQFWQSLLHHWHQSPIVAQEGFCDSGIA
jgi:hypothetical protein